MRPDPDRGRCALHGENLQDPGPHKRVLMPTLEAECSLDLGYSIDQFSAFCDAHPIYRGGLMPIPRQR